jgi:hypothetical protein
MVKTVNRAPDILKSLLQKLKIGKRLIDKGKEKENRAVRPLTNRITSYTQPSRYGNC